MFRALAVVALLSTQLLSAADLEPHYFGHGNSNTPTSFGVRMLINRADIASMDNLYANVQYAPLSDSKNLQVTQTQKVVITKLLIKGKKHLGMEVKGLRETTVYRARLNLYRRTGSSESVHVASSPFYYTTTTGTDPKSLVRNRMLLIGFNEFYLGGSGANKVSGTKYGADVGEKWCSEFYSYVAHRGGLKGIMNLGSFNKLIEYFRVGLGLHNRSAIPTLARRGDYLAMDTDLVDGTNHSGMFLAFEKATDGEFVWTLEGNSGGSKILVHRRPYNKVFTHLGHIMKGQF